MHCFFNMEAVTCSPIPIRLLSLVKTYTEQKKFCNILSFYQTLLKPGDMLNHTLKFWPLFPCLLLFLLIPIKAHY